MCVTPAGKIGNCTCGMPKLLPHSGKKSSLLSLFNRSKTVSSHFLFLPLFHPAGSGVLSLLIDVTCWLSPDYNSLVENFLLHRKRNPFLRRIWIGPQSAEIIEHLLFVLGQSRALK